MEGSWKQSCVDCGAIHAKRQTATEIRRLMAYGCASWPRVGLSWSVFLLGRLAVTPQSECFAASLD